VELPFDLWHLSHRPAEYGEATRWLRQWLKETKMKQPDIEELPGFVELFQKSIVKYLAGLTLEERLEELRPDQWLTFLTPEERLAGLTPEQRLAGLAPEQVVLALPVEMLRLLPEDYVRSLPAEVQAQIQKRLQGSAH
jgi:hypothetical protein